MKCSIKLLADDMKIWKNVEREEDQIELQGTQYYGVMVR